MRGVILLAILLAFVAVSCGTENELPDLTATSLNQEAQPTNTAKPVDTVSPAAAEPSHTPQPANTPIPTGTPTNEPPPTKVPTSTIEPTQTPTSTPVTPPAASEPGDRAGVSVFGSTMNLLDT